MSDQIPSNDPKSQAALSSGEGSGVTVVAESLTENAIAEATRSRDIDLQKEEESAPPIVTENVNDDTENPGSTDVTNPMPTVLLDETGKVSFETPEGIESRNSRLTYLEDVDPKELQIVQIISSKTVPDKISDVNVMLGVQEFPSMSQTALHLQAPQSFARNHTIPVESEVGVTSVQRQGAKSHIEDGTVFSTQNLSSNDEKEQNASIGPLLVSMSLAAIHFSRQFDEPNDGKIFDDQGVKATNSNPAIPQASNSNPNVTITVNAEQGPPQSIVIPLRRTQSNPVPNNTRRKSVLEKLPEDIKSIVRSQLQEISIHLRLVMQELIKAEDKILSSQGPPPNADDKEKPA